MTTEPDDPLIEQPEPSGEALAQEDATLASANEKLTDKQQRAIEVLLVGGTDAQAAQAAGVVRNTVTLWRNHNPDFATALLDARAEMLSRMRSRLHAATSIAVRTLEEVARDVNVPSARVAAARALLEYSHRAMEMEELEVRLAKLETALAERPAARR